jgi:hypothetical protein
MNKNIRNYVIFTMFIVFSLVSWLTNFEFGISVWDNFLIFAIDMVIILPPAFILIGLFDVWAKKNQSKSTLAKQTIHYALCTRFYWHQQR